MKRKASFAAFVLVSTCLLAFAGFTIVDGIEPGSKNDKITVVPSIITVSKFCGAPVKIPMGSDVRKVDDHLLVTFPPGITITGADDTTGRPLYGESGNPTVREEVVYDCQCGYGAPGECDPQWIPPDIVQCLMVRDCVDNCELLIGGS